MRNLWVWFPTATLGSPRESTGPFWLPQPPEHTHGRVERRGETDRQTDRVKAGKQGISFTLLA